MTAVAIDTDPIRVGIKEQAEQAKRRGKGEALRKVDPILPPMERKTAGWYLGNGSE